MVDLLEEKHMQEQIVSKRVPTNEVGSHIGESITVSGWLHSRREMGGLSFLVLRDAWGTLQSVAETEEELRPLREQAAGTQRLISIPGPVVPIPQARPRT